MGAAQAVIVLLELLEVMDALVITEVAAAASIFALRSLHKRRLVAGDPSGGGGGGGGGLQFCLLMVKAVSFGGRHLLLLVFLHVC